MSLLSSLLLQSVAGDRGQPRLCEFVPEVWEQASSCCDKNKLEFLVTLLNAVLCCRRRGNLYCLPNPCDALSAEDIDAIEESEEVWDLCENWPSSYVFSSDNVASRNG